MRRFENAMSALPINFMCENSAISCWPISTRSKVSMNLSYTDLPSFGKRENEEGEKRNQTSAVSPAIFTCYFQTLGICAWIPFASHDHCHGCTVFKPNRHGTRQLFIDNRLHNFIQITFQQWKNYLQKYRLAN